MNEDIILQENSSLVIRQIIKKYGFEQAQEEGVETLLSSAPSQEKTIIFDNLPGSKIAQIIRGFYLKELDWTGLISQLKTRLDITEETAIKIADDLKKDLFNNVSSEKIYTETNNTNAPEENNKNSDTYRESTE
jgi:hypothetical protein